MVNWQLDESWQLKKAAFSDRAAFWVINLGINHPVFYLDRVSGMDRDDGVNHRILHHHFALRLLQNLNPSALRYSGRWARHSDWYIHKL
jgi:hypothetical protein